MTTGYVTMQLISHPVLRLVTKSAPLTVSVKSGRPAVRDAGLNEEMEGRLMLTGTEFESVTVLVSRITTWAVPTVVNRLAGIKNTICDVDAPNRGVKAVGVPPPGPVHLSSALPTGRFVPLTVR